MKKFFCKLKKSQSKIKFVRLCVNNLMFLTTYSQTLVNDHLRITTTCLQRPPFRGPNFNFYNTKLPLNNDHLSTTATNFGSLGGSLYTSLTVINNKIESAKDVSVMYKGMTLKIVVGVFVIALSSILGICSTLYRFFAKRNF
jgi:hypothetical protein